jgi:hypothetical protein
VGRRGRPLLADLLDCRVLLLLRLEALACLDGCGKLYNGCERRAVLAAKRGTHLLAGPGSPRTAPAASSACRPCRGDLRGRESEQEALGCGLELELDGGGILKRASMAGLDSGLGRGRCGVGDGEAWGSLRSPQDNTLCLCCCTAHGPPLSPPSTLDPRLAALWTSPYSARCTAASHPAPALPRANQPPSAIPHRKLPTRRARAQAQRRCTSPLAAYSPVSRQQ